MKAGCHRRAGVTALELIVSLAIVAVCATISTLAHRHVGQEGMPPAVEHLMRARAGAIRRGQRIVIRDTLRGHLVFATALPDGRLFASAELLDTLVHTERGEVR